MVLALSILAAVLLAGCASPQADWPVLGTNWTPPVFRGAINRAVCIGLTNIEDGSAPCPGCDVDASTVWGWVHHDRPVALLLNAQATIANVQAMLTAATEGIAPDGLLTISISSHGITRPDLSGDEADGVDEGILLWDGVWWDDDIWDFICALPPCRIDLYTDTCHAEGNWRAFGRAVSFGTLFRPRYIQLELDLPGVRGVEPLPWAGSIVQFAGCREESYSMGSVAGGTWTQTLDALRSPGQSRQTWFHRARDAMPEDQEPVLSLYNVSLEMLEGDALK